MSRDSVGSVLAMSMVLATGRLSSRFLFHNGSLVVKGRIKKLTSTRGSRRDVSRSSLSSVLMMMMVTGSRRLRHNCKQ